MVGFNFINEVILQPETFAVFLFGVGYFIKSRINLINNRKIHFHKMCSVRLKNFEPIATINELKQVKDFINNIPALFDVNNNNLKNSLSKFAYIVNSNNDFYIKQYYDDILISIKMQCHFVPRPEIFNKVYSFELDGFTPYRPTMIYNHEKIEEQLPKNLNAQLIQTNAFNNLSQDHKNVIQNLLHDQETIDKVTEFLESIK